MVSAAKKESPLSPVIPGHLEVIKRSDDDEALEAVRATGLGGTDLPKILGVSRFGTPFEVFARKTGLAKSKPSTELQEAGRILEPWILRRFAARTQIVLWAPHATFRVKDRPWEVMNPDAFDLDLELVADAKSRSPFDRKSWGEEDSDVTPDEERIQVEWYCALSGAKRWALPVSFDREVVIFRGNADPALGEMLREEAERFWKEHVLKGVPPTPISGEAAAEFIRRRFPRNLSPMREATEAETELARLWKSLGDAEAVASGERENIENEIKLCIGEADGIRGPTWSFSYKRTADYLPQVDFAQVVRTLELDLSLPDSIRQRLSELIVLNSRPGAPGTRRFVPSRVFVP